MAMDPAIVRSDVDEAFSVCLVVVCGDVIVAQLVEDWDTDKLSRAEAPDYLRNLSLSIAVGRIDHSVF